MRVAVIGAGSWGTTVAVLASRNVPTILWARRPEVGKEIVEDRSNRRYLPDYVLPEALEATSDLEEAARAAAVLVVDREPHVRHGEFQTRT